MSRPRYIRLQTTQAEEAATELVNYQAIYSPPWLDPGTPNPPRCQTEWQLQTEEYRQSTAGGGLWDPEQENL